MIVVRDVFHLKFGKAKEAKTLIKEGLEINKNFGVSRKAMMDLVGKAYTLVLESEFKSLTDFENEMKDTFSKPEWGAWYQRIIPLIDNSYREIFTLVE